MSKRLEDVIGEINRLPKEYLEYNTPQRAFGGQHALGKAI
jgi:IS30 family transposase